MFANWKAKLEEKRYKNQGFIQAQNWRNNALLQECFAALRGSFTVALAVHQEAAEAVVNIALAEDSWTEVDSVPEAFLSAKCYIIWDEATLPVLLCDSALCLENIEDVEAVNLHTYLVSETMDRIIWFDGHTRIKLYSIA